MIAFSTTEDGKRVCVVINWAKWNNPDKTGTERQRKHRESRVTNGLVTRDTTVTHALVTKPEEIRGEESRKHPPTPLVTVTVPSRPIRNASDDGAMGMTVTAWSDGLSLVTGAPSSPLAAKAVQILVGALAAHRPVDAEPVAWSRQIAADYATANKNRTLSPFGFSDWLASGKPQKPAPANGAAPPKTGADPYAPPELRIEPIVGAATPAEVKEIFAELAKTLRRSEEATK